MPVLLDVYVPLYDFLYQVNPTHWTSSWSWGEAGGDSSLQETVLMDFSGPHHFHKDFRQKMPCAFDIILGLWVFNSVYCAYSIHCVQSIPSFSCLSDLISAVPAIVRGRTSTLAFTVQTIQKRIKPGRAAGHVHWSGCLCFHGRTIEVGYDLPEK